MKKTVLMGLLALSVTILGACFDFNMESSQSEQQNASSLTENVLSSETVVSSERFSSDENPLSVDGLLQSLFAGIAEELPTPKKKKKSN